MCVLKQAVVVEYPNQFKVIIRYSHPNEVEIYASGTMWTRRLLLENFKLELAKQ